MVDEQPRLPVIQREGTIDISGPKEPAVRFTTDTRRRIQSLANLDELEVELPLQGQRKLTAEYSDPAMWDRLRECLGYAERAPLVVARQGLDGEIRGIVDVLGVEAALPPEWAERIDELSRLRSGWLYQDSEAPSRQVLDATEEFLLGCVDESMTRPKIYPSAEGGVQLEWPSETRPVEVELRNDGRITLSALDMVGEDDRELSLSGLDTDRMIAFAK